MTDRDSEPGRPLDEVALEALYARLEKPVFNVVYRWLWDPEEARDVTQEAFVKLWKARERVDLATVDQLVFRTALNLAANRARRRRLWRLLTLEQATEEPSSLLSADRSLKLEERRRRVRRAIDRLPERLKKVVVMCELSGLSYREVSFALEIPTGTVGSRRNLALAALEKDLGRWEDL